MPSSISHDVVVLGTGAGGLVAALAAARAGVSVGIYEKADLVGGSTAISGGVVWIPLNHHQDEDGIADSREDALDYLDSLSLDRMDPELAATFVDNGRETIEWLEDVTSIRFSILPDYPDYQPENPGGRPAGGRSLDPGLFAFPRLGEWSGRIARSRRSAHLTIADTTLGGGTGFLDDETAAYRSENDLRGCGNALVGPLLEALLGLGVEPVLNSPARDLIVEDGRVVGARILIDGVEETVLATRGVVLATGGFEWNPDLVREFLRGPMTAPTSVPTNTGDGLLMAMRTGARLANMGQAWWVPAVQIPGDTAFGTQRSSLVNRERTLPGSIMVNARGRRFTNEASNYNSLGGAFHQMDSSTFGYANLPAWLVFDAHHAREYGSFGTPAGDPIGDWIERAPTVRELADLVGIDPSGLEETVSRWNRFVDAGRDEEFRRGESAYDRWSGDGRHRFTKASTLGRLDEGPYYAVPIQPGALGTSGGPRTDAKGRVLDTRMNPIPGLFAAGNVAAAPTAMAYGGAGGTLGPILVFGRRAGESAAANSGP
ncbi:MAG: FAD-dependent oxidoreductase [bacterium]|nr:FAD-dependent oxidoreductase [bacterium]